MWAAKLSADAYCIIQLKYRHNTFGLMTQHAICPRRFQKATILTSVCFILLCTKLSAQAVCEFGSNPADGAFAYNRDALDNLLQLQNYSAVIYGEQHNDCFEPVFKINFLTHLNEQYGYRDVFVETGYATAWLFNRYLESGDTSYLFPFPTHRRFILGYMWGSYLNAFWKPLYVFNQSLPSDRRMRFHGADFERKESFSVLLMLLPKEKLIPLSLEPVFTALRTYISDTTWRDFTPEASEKYEHVRDAFHQNEGAMRSLYGASYNVVEKIIANDAKQQGK